MRDGGVLVVKNVELVPPAEPPCLGPLSADPGYEPWDCPAAEAHAVGRVPRTLCGM